jgi:hypothetical protein
LYDERDIDSAPIVFLDSEGSECSQIMANSTAEFLALLATGNEDLFDMDFPENEGATFKTFRRWLQNHGINVPSGVRVDEILAEAEKSHPSLREWIDLHTPN